MKAWIKEIKVYIKLKLELLKEIKAYIKEIKALLILI